MNDYTYLLDVAREVLPPPDGIVSRTLHQDERVKVILFGFGAGQELSEHTAAVPAILQFVQGEATVGLGGDTCEAKPGTWIHMPPQLKHSIRAQTPVVMVLTLLK